MVSPRASRFLTRPDPCFSSRRRLIRVNLVVKMLNDSAREFLNATAWSAAACEPLTGDASARKYFRLRKDEQSAVLMDASQIPESVAPFIQINQHLHQLGFSAPAILSRADEKGLLLLEDFGDATFTRLLDKQPSRKNFIRWPPMS